MAKVGGPLHSSIAVGQVAKALIYNNWRGIAYVKGYKGPANPATAAQLAIRSFMTTCAQAWQDVSDANRLAWQTWADANQPNDPQFNRPVPWSGFNAYTRLGVRLLHVGEAVVATPPIVAAPGGVTGLGLEQVAADIVVTWDATAGTNMKLDGYVWKNPSPVRNPNIPLFRHWWFSNAEEATASMGDAEITTWYFLCRIFSEDDGQVSGWVRDQITVTGV